jgi:hypothetical protein
VAIAPAEPENSGDTCERVAPIPERGHLQTVMCLNALDMQVVSGSAALTPSRARQGPRSLCRQLHDARAVDGEARDPGTGSEVAHLVVDLSSDVERHHEVKFDEPISLELSSQDWWRSYVVDLFWSKDKASALGCYGEASKEVSILALGAVEARLYSIPAVPVERQSALYGVQKPVPARVLEEDVAEQAGQHGRLPLALQPLPRTKRVLVLLRRKALREQHAR